MHFQVCIYWFMYIILKVLNFKQLFFFLFPYIWSSWLYLDIEIWMQKKNSGVIKSLKFHTLCYKYGINKICSLE